MKQMTLKLFDIEFTIPLSDRGFRVIGILWVFFKMFFTAFLLMLMVWCFNVHIVLGIAYLITLGVLRKLWT